MLDKVGARVVEWQNMKLRSSVKVYKIPEDALRGVLCIEDGRIVKTDERLTIEKLLIFGDDVVCNRELGLPNRRTADVLWRGELWEIKSIHGRGRYVVHNALRKAKLQSENIILDISGQKKTIERMIFRVKDEMRDAKRIRKVLIICANSYCIISRNEI